MVLPTGSVAPPGAPAGPVLLAFFKDTCPVCALAFPMVGELARRYGDALPVVAVAQDPPERAEPWLAGYGLAGSYLDDSEGYPLSDAFGVRTVPTLFLLDGAPDGATVGSTVGSTVEAVAEGWDRERYNALDAALAGRTGRPSPGPVSSPEDGLPVFKPG